MSEVPLYLHMPHLRITLETLAASPGPSALEGWSREILE